MIRKVKILLVLSAICMSFACASSSELSATDSEIWVGISYVASKNGASAEASAAIGAIGVLDAAAWGFGVGMVAGPVAGAAAGVVSGL